MLVCGYRKGGYYFLALHTIQQERPDISPVPVSDAELERVRNSCHVMVTRPTTGQVTYSHMVMSTTGLCRTLSEARVIQFQESVRISLTGS